jgi:predicted transcriptional regulator
VPFALPGMNYSIYVPIAHKSVKNKNKETLKEVLAHLITEIQRVFAKKLDK